MYCDKCGYKNWNNSRFCRKCGNPLIQLDAGGAEQMHQADPANSRQFKNSFSDQREERGIKQQGGMKAPESEAKKKRLPLILSMIAVLVVIIGGSLYASMKTGTSEIEKKELYFPVDYIYTSKWDDEEEEKTREKYSYYFDGLTMYSSRSNENLQIRTYREDGSLEKSYWYSQYSDDDISCSFTRNEYDEKGRCIKSVYEYNNVYGGKNHSSSDTSVYVYEGNETKGKLAEQIKTENGETLTADIVFNADNKLEKITFAGSEKTSISEYTFNEDGNQTKRIDSTYEKGELVSNSVTEYTYDENGDLINSVDKDYEDGKLTSTFTIDYNDESPYIESYHSVYESIWEDGSKHLSVSDSLTNNAKVEILNGRLVPADSDAFREMDEEKLEKLKKIITKYEELEKKAE